ncbi:MAG: Fur family transcriptional regulator [Terrimicrobiaceae bacterium]
MGETHSQKSRSCQPAERPSTRQSTFTVDAVLARLRQEGMRITPARRKILEVLFSAGEPLSLQDIQTASGVDSVVPDYATVFRMVVLLEKLKVVQKVNLQRPCSYYELHDPARHYDHLVCTSCGKVVVIDTPCPLGDLETRLAERYGFSDLSHSLEFFGQCSQCR